VFDSVFLDCHLATMNPDVPGPYGALRDGAVAVRGERIAWLGARADLPREAAASAEVHRLGGRWVTPGLIDPHTHLVFGGNRAQEFELRLGGVSYEDIARRGGGILATVQATREADEATLERAAARWLEALLAEGVTTVEIKSGYGLDRDTEMRQLRVARRLGERHPVTVVSTFLGAHALPPEYRERPDAYVDFVCREVLPAVAEAGLADAVDAFCERIGFSPEQVARVFETARSHGLTVKLHAEQLSDQGGAALAARYGALSADHLEYVSEAGIEAMARAGTVAVLLPGAFYFLRETRLPPVARLRERGVPMALATDSNPGTSPACSLLLMANMACTLFRLTPGEALAGITREAARALGLAASRGTLEAGKRADLVVWDIEHPAELAYRIGYNPCHRVVRGGRVVRARG